MPLAPAPYLNSPAIRLYVFPNHGTMYRLHVFLKLKIDQHAAVSRTCVMLPSNQNLILPDEFLLRNRKV